MFEMVTKENRKNKNTPILPQRATTHSAGYDFFCPTQLVIPPHSTKLIWTDIKIELNPNEFLLMVPRSSMAIKKSIQLTNSPGIIDADYYNNPSTEGNIAISLHNFGTDTQILESNERIAQGIILNYKAFEELYIMRKGGIGSTS